MKGKIYYSNSLALRDNPLINNINAKEELITPLADYNYKLLLTETYFDALNFKILNNGGFLRIVKQEKIAGTRRNDTQYFLDYKKDKKDPGKRISIIKGLRLEDLQNIGCEYTDIVESIKLSSIERHLFFKINGKLPEYFKEMLMHRVANEDMPQTIVDLIVTNLKIERFKGYPTEKQIALYELKNLTRYNDFSLVENKAYVREQIDKVYANFSSSMSDFGCEQVRQNKYEFLSKLQQKNSTHL